MVFLLSLRLIGVLYNLEALFQVAGSAPRCYGREARDWVQKLAIQDRMSTPAPNSVTIDQPSDRDEAWRTRLNLRIASNAVNC
jgi:hypothetical protein